MAKNVKSTLEAGDVNWTELEEIDIYTEKERTDYSDLYNSTLNVIERNQIIEGIVVAMTDKDVVLNIGFKSDGLVSLNEFRGEKELKLVDGKKYKTVEYDAIHGLLINCIKELKEEIKELKNGFTK